MRRWHFRSVLTLCSVVAVASCTETPISSLSQTTTPTRQLDEQVSPPLIAISQVYGGGGNAGATLKNDFIELFNPGTSAVSLAGWSVQYASAAGTTWQVTALTGSIPAGGYYLVQEAQGTNGTVNLPTPEATGTIAMGGGNGKVLLAKVTTAQTGACPTGGNIVDEVSYGTGTNCGFAPMAANTSNAQSAARKDAGCKNTGRTVDDFEIITAAPRNGATLKHPCQVIDNVVAFVKVLPQTPSVVQGTQVTFAATAENAAHQSVTATFTWTVDDEARATIDATGKVTTLQPGDVKVVAKADGTTIADTADLHIDPPTVVSATVSPLAPSIDINATVAMTATALSATNQPIANVVFTWTIAPATLASVNPVTGLVKGLQAGDAVVTATAPNGVFATTTVHVNAPPPPAIPLVITEIMANPNGLDTDGEWFEVFNPTANAVSMQGWKVESNGDAGFTINTPLTIASHGFVVFGVSNTIPGVTVNYVFTASSTGLVLANGNTAGSAEFVQLKDQNGSVADRVNWNTYAATSGASRVLLDAAADNLDASGSAWENTSTDIVYGTGNNHGTPGAGDYDHGPIATLTITPNPSFVSTIGSFQMRYSGRDADGKNVRTPLVWSSANDAIATIDPATGIVQGHSVGNVNITATAENGVTGTALLKVLLPGVPASISVSINDPAQVPVGYTKPAFISIVDADFKPVSGFTNVVWSSDDNSVATVDQRGYIHGEGAGSTRIRVTTTDGTATGSRSFTVLPATAPTSAIYRNHVAFGTPTDNTPGDDAIIENTQYILSYNATRGGPNWVSWNLNATQFGAAPRCDCFTADTRAPVYIEDADYRNGGYDRGHMVQSESRTTTDQENASTFLLSNILPQAAANNQGSWSKEENFLNDLVRNSGKEIYVVAGGIYAPTAPTLKGEGKVAIPDYTFKIAVIMNAGQGLADVHSQNDLQVIVVKMPNLIAATSSNPATLAKDTAWQVYSNFTVDDIEAATGYDFLSDLPDNIEIAIESNTHPPVAAVDGPFNANAHDNVTFSAAGSSDADAGQTLTYSWTFGDGGTGAGVTASHTYTHSGNYTVQMIVTDPLGIADTASTSARITDTSAPDIAATVTGDKTNGWYTTDVGVHWNVSDPESDIASSTGCADASLTTDTNGVTFTCAATNGDGLSRSVDLNIKRDASAPSVTYTGNAGTYAVDATVNITCSSQDVGPSGMASTTCANVSGAAYTFGLGSHTYSATGTDNAGNVGSGSTSFTVTVSTTSLTTLVNAFVTKPGVANSLNVKLSHGQIDAFINEVQAQSGKALTVAQAALLIQLAQSL